MENNTNTLFNQMAEAMRPHIEPQIEPLKLFKFKPNLCSREDEVETVIAESLAHAVRKNPTLLTWHLVSITK